MNDQELETTLDAALAAAAPEVEEPEVKEEQQETPQNQNFKQLRQRAEAAERDRDRFANERDYASKERDELARRYDNFMRQYDQPKNNNLTPEEELGDDEIVEVKVLKKYTKKLEDKLQQVEQKMYLQDARAQTQGKHKDFYEVVTDDNINKLIKDYPDIARTLETSPDMTSKLSSAYTLIKKLVLEETVKNDQYEDARNTVQNNAAKPKPASSIANQSNTALSKAHTFQTAADREQRRRQVEAELDNYAKGG